MLHDCMTKIMIWCQTLIKILNKYRQNRKKNLMPEIRTYKPTIWTVDETGIDAISWVDETGTMCKYSRRNGSRQNGSRRNGNKP